MHLTPMDIATITGIAISVGGTLGKWVDMKVDRKLLQLHVDLLRQIDEKFESLSLRIDATLNGRAR